MPVTTSDILENAHTQDGRLEKDIIQERIDNSYLHHSPKGDQAERYVSNREAAKAFMGVLVENNKATERVNLSGLTPELEHAFHYIDLALMMANASIARNE